MSLEKVENFHLFSIKLKKHDKVKMKMDEITGNMKYDLKTIKLKPETYNKLIRAKARLEFSKSELHSFDGFIDHMLDMYFVDEEVFRNK